MDSADTSGQGVRVEYRARVPRHLLGAALAEALAAIARETADDQDPPPAPDRRADVAAATNRAFDIPPHLTRRNRTP
ncbi:hypothetical protein [Streptomyces sulphureus]|uniref:hypothetical protein n=1 Tax=Streptomyces sulphureus TaxID=47758 RepID=UPI000399E0E0|nr:hypothetical protein [Streptomyces sulphureus]